jgi:hypothetical protein
VNSAILILLAACSADSPVKEYFEMHGMDYPADVSGIGIMSMNHVGIAREELLEPEAREFVEEGIMTIKIHLIKKNAAFFMEGIDGVVVTKPVLFRDETEEVGLMVKVTAFGTGEPDSSKGIETEWVGKDKRFWKAVNFAYFHRNEFYRWEFGGWVY